MHVYFLLGKEEFLMDEFIYKAPYEEEASGSLKSISCLKRTAALIAFIVPLTGKKIGIRRMKSRIWGT